MVCEPLEQRFEVGDTAVTYPCLHLVVPAIDRVHRGREPSLFEAGAQRRSVDCVQAALRVGELLRHADERLGEQLRCASQDVLACKRSNQLHLARHALHQ